jgi:predicted ArsR family transcriptional regulator
MTTVRDESIRAVASLADPMRRALYEFVRAADPDAGRSEAADALGIKRSLAAFHLDALVKEGLLEVTFRRPPGRGGPGAGRPAKRYRVSAADVSVSLPPRHYLLAAEILLHALNAFPKGKADNAVRTAARASGEQLAGHAAVQTRDDPSDALTSALSQLGFATRCHADGVITLEACPFHSLTATDRDTACAMNHALLEGLVDTLELADAYAATPGSYGRCCVAFTPTSSAVRPDE